MPLRAILMCLICSLTGCSYFRNVNTAEQWDRGYLVVLPGVEGESWFNSNIAQGLRDGGVDSAIEVYDWTTGHWVLFPLHLRHLERNREQARTIAGKIVAYQDAYPGRPVHVVGNSGGGGVAMLTLEALPEDRQVTSVVLLAPAISPNYDICRALEKTEHGIWNYHSGGDWFILGAGTSLFGTVDGRHTPSAGMIGFNLPADRRDDAAITNKLHQIPYDPHMLANGHYGGHFSVNGFSFVRDWVASRITSQPDTSASAIAEGTDETNLTRTAAAEAEPTK